MVKQQIFTFLSRYNVLLWITWYCFLYFLSVFQESSKNYEAFRIRRHLDVTWKNSVSSAIEASTSPFWLLSFQTFPCGEGYLAMAWVYKITACWETVRYQSFNGSPHLRGAVILPKGWQQYLLDRQWGDTNCAWSKKMMPASWWVSWMMLWVFSSLAVNLETSQALT